METNGINVLDSVRDYEEKKRKRGRRTGFLLGTLAALGVVGLLGAGFMLMGGKSGGEAPRRSVAVPVSATATLAPADEQGEPNEGQVLTANDAPQGTSGGSSSGGSTDSGGSDNGAEPVIPTETSVPVDPTDTPEPTDTPTETPTVTPTVTPDDGCVFCIDPGIIVDLDFTAPGFLSGGRTHCPEGTIVAVTLDEEATIWVEYTVFGFDVTTATQEGSIGYFNLGGGPMIFPAMNIVVHAEDGWGNHSTFDPPLFACP